MEKIHRRIVDHYFSMRALLNSIGYDIGEHDKSVYCPFHDDKRGGHMSARYYHETDSIFCWSCARPYRSMDVLTALYSTLLVLYY